MDYEKKYNEALERARANYKADKEMGFLENCDMLELIFPELRESEDERIRKRLLWFLAHYEGRWDYPEKRMACRAWLEKQKDASKAIEAVDRIDKYIDEHLANAHDMKDSNPDKKYYRGWDDALGEMAGILQDVYSDEKQKEQKSKDDEEKYLDGIKRDWFNRGKKEVLTVPELYGLEKQKEQKPVEKQDYSGLNDFERAIHRGFLCAGVENVPVTIINETAKDCLANLYDVPEPEWSEEDEKMRDSILAELANHICYNNPPDGMPSGTGWASYKYQQEMDWLTNRLKSLSPSWKPSEEQMAWLKLAIDEAKDPLKSQLEELYKNIRENLIWK